MSDIDKYRKGLACLVPKQGVKGDIDFLPLTSHEQSLCDCQVLEIFAAYDKLEAELKDCRLLVEHLGLISAASALEGAAQAKLKIAVEAMRSALEEASQAKANGCVITLECLHDHLDEALAIATSAVSEKK